jgi:anaerobic selenocysteine-containing dehydrogenase
MKQADSMDRRRLLATGAAGLAAGVAMTWGGTGRAATNAGLRTALKYQDTPKDGQPCSGCMHWVPGATPKDRGGCKIIPGDTEISPAGWCTAWVKAAR